VAGIIRRKSFFRMRQSHFLTRTCTVPGSETTVTPAGDGTWSESAGDGTAGVKCSFVAAAGNERVVGGAVAQIGNYVLTFERDAVLNAKMTIPVDALEVDGVEVEAARTFQLVAPLDGPVTILQRWVATSSDSED
jgi:hypothetical protein